MSAFRAKGKTDLGGGEYSGIKMLTLNIVLQWHCHTGLSFSSEEKVIKYFLKPLGGDVGLPRAHSLAKKWPPNGCKILNKNLQCSGLINYESCWSQIPANPLGGGIGASFFFNFYF